MSANTVKPSDPKRKAPGGNLPKERMLRQSGIDGDPNPQKVPKLNVPPSGEVVYFGPYGSHIALGGDRLNPRKGFKYGGGKAMAGVTACAHVDIVAGLDSFDTYKNRIPTVPVNPDAFRDAARVYISQNCDVDDQFTCADGSIGNIKNKSAAVIKADGVRIIGREGIKIITGTDSANSRGKTINSVPPIDLIAGNAPPEMMQPIPRGMNLRDALQTIVDRINQLSGIVDNFFTEQQAFNSVLAWHDHPDFISMAISGIATSGTSTKAFFNGNTYFNMDVAIQGLKNQAAGIRIKKDFLLHKCAMSGLVVEYLRPSGLKWINSRQVNTS